MADCYLWLTEGQRLRNTTENALCHKAYSFVAPVFEDWPKNYFGFLEWVNKYEGYRGLSDLHKNVSKQCGRNSLFFVISALEDFINKKLDVPQDSSELWLSLKSQFVNKREACLKLQIDEEWLEVLIARERVEIFNAKGDETLIYLPSLELLLSEICNLMIHWSAAEFLGVRASDVMYLICNGCLLPSSGPEIGGFREWALNPSEVTGLMKKIERKVIGGELPKDDKVTPGWEVLKYLKQYGLSVGKFILDILNDEIVPVGELPCEGITKFLFRKDQVIGYRRSLHPEDHPLDYYNYHEKIFKKINRQKATATNLSGERRSKVSEKLLKGMVILLDRAWAQNELVCTNKGIESFNIKEVALTAKLLFALKDRVE